MQIVIGHFFKWHKAKINAKMNFYTGIQTIEMFNVILILIKNFLPNIVYWTAPTKYTVTSWKNSI